MKRRISVISIGVADLDRSRRFYEALGFEARPESSERAVFFELEWSWLSLFPRDRLAGLANVSPEGSGFQGFVLSHNVASAEEVDEVIELALKAGGSLRVSPESTSQSRIGYFADPDGYAWEVAYTPRWPELTA